MQYVKLNMKIEYEKIVELLINIFHFFVFFEISYIYLKINCFRKIL